VIAKTQNFELQKTCTAYGDIIFKIPKYYLKTPRVVYVGLEVDEVAPDRFSSLLLSVSVYQWSIFSFIRSFITHRHKIFLATKSLKPTLLT